MPAFTTTRAHTPDDALITGAARGIGRRSPSASRERGEQRRDFESASWDDLDLALWPRALSVDVTGQILMCKAFLPMIADAAGAPIGREGRSQRRGRLAR